jgi:hypothetical protein
MATRIEVEKSGTNVVLRAPEHPLLVERAASLGGRSSKSGWTFGANKEDQVRKLARELWGTDGRETERVAVRVDLSLYGEGPLGRFGEAWLCGRLVARRRTFDSPVELGEGVKLVSGSFSTWGGSPGRPALGARYGTVIDVADIPTSAGQRAEKEFPFEVKVIKNGEAQVGAWARSITERIPGPLHRAEAKMGGKAAPKAAAPAAKASAAPAPAPPPARKSAPAPAPKAKAPAPAPQAKAAPAPVKKKKAAPAPKAKPAPKMKAAPSATKKTAAAPKRKAAKKSTKKAAAAAPRKKVAKKAPARKAAPRKAARRAAPKAARRPMKKAPARKAAKAKAKATRRRR